MSRNLRALATSTSWPHSSKCRLTQGEWVPVSTAMRKGRSEASPQSFWGGAQPALLYNLTAFGVDEAQVGVFVAEVQSCGHLRLFPANIHF
jgi:hypothetical protein